MLSWLANAWRVPELRRRVLFTFSILALYRLGSWIPAPGVDSQTIKDYFHGRGGTILGLLNVFSGGALSQFALFALGIMPYVTASIILQLMTVVVPKLEQLQKEGESGYAKINQYTRYLTVALAAAQSTGYAYLFKRAGHLEPTPAGIVLIVVTLTAGTTLLMWMGELITKRGIGNGISLLIFASILSSAPGRASAPGTTAARWSGCSSRSSRSPSSPRSSSSRRASGGFRSSTRSGWSAAARRPAARPTCRCASTWPASSRSSSPPRSWRSRRRSRSSSRRRRASSTRHFPHASAAVPAARGRR